MFTCNAANLFCQLPFEGRVIAGWIIRTRFPESGWSLVSFEEGLGLGLVLKCSYVVNK